MVPVLFTVGPITIYTFGIFALLAFFFGSFVIWKRGKEANYSEEEIFDSIVLVTIAGILGARALYVATHFERFGWNPLSWISFIRLSGLSFYGGFVVGVFALFLLSRRRRWSFFTLGDIGVTSLSLAQAIGWVGALFSGFGVGRVVERFGLVFPGSTIVRFPAQLVWALGFSLVFVFLWNVEQRYRTYDWYRGRKSVAASGFIFFSYLISLGMLQIIVVLFTEARVYWFRIPAEVIAGLLILIIGMGGMYIKSGRVFSEDREVITQALSHRGVKGFGWLKSRSQSLSKKLLKRNRGE